MTHIFSETSLKEERRAERKELSLAKSPKEGLYDHERQNKESEDTE